MSLIRFNPNMDPFSSFDDLLPNLPALRSTMTSFMPAIDMYEEKNTLVVETPLAGINPTDVDVSVENGILTIKGRTSKEHEVEEKNYYHKETRNGSFYRQVLLPVSVSEDAVSAELENGVLKILLPKKELQEPKKVNITVVKNKKK